MLDSELIKLFIEIIMLGALVGSLTGYLFTFFSR